MFRVKFSRIQACRAHPDHRHVEVINPVVNVKQAEKLGSPDAVAEEMRFRIREAMAQRNGSEAFLTLAALG
jgi:hypothetical protein